LRNIWKINLFTKHQTQCHTSVLHGRRVFTYTQLDTATAVAEVYEDQFQYNPEEDNFDKIYGGGGGEAKGCCLAPPATSISHYP
jgi:hypothetical protein